MKDYILLDPTGKESNEMTFLIVNENKSIYMFSWIIIEKYLSQYKTWLNSNYSKFFYDLCFYIEPCNMIRFISFDYLPVREYC